MNYEKLFNSMFPGFFNETGIKNLSEDRIYAELIMDLRETGPKPVPDPFPSSIEFGIYHGGIEKVREAVCRVDKEWIPFFSETRRIFCAYDMDAIVSFCILEDWGNQAGVRIGGPGCVGTVPEYRKKGIGLEMVRQASAILKEENFDISWIHYTHLWRWYEKLGYKTVLRWNCKGILPTG